MHFLSQLRDFVLASVGPVMVFGIPGIIMALNTGGGMKKAEKKDG